MRISFPPSILLFAFNCCPHATFHYLTFRHPSSKLLPRNKLISSSQGQRMENKKGVPDGYEPSYTKMDLHGLNATPIGKAVETGTILQLQTCPYNESHRVGQGSFATHLHNCRKKLAPKVQQLYVICEYNETHHMLGHVYKDHLKICTDFKNYQAQNFELPAELFGLPKKRNFETDKDRKERLAKEEMRAQKEEEAERLKNDQKESLRRKARGEEQKKMVEEEEQFLK